MEKVLLHRKEGIIISTIEAINEVGFQNLSTKLIAKREGISEGTLFRHFKRKADILIAVLDHFSQYDNDIIQTSKNKKLNPIEAIEYFIHAYAEYYENYPEITVIIQNYDSLLCDPDLSDLIREIIIQRSDFIIQRIRDGQRLGMIRSDIDCENLRDLIMGGFKEICLRWRMEKYNFSLKDRILSMLHMVLDAFSNKV